jgi:imidazolonepropionase-like amidohydrolase
MRESRLARFGFRCAAAVAGLVIGFAAAAGPADAGALALRVDTVDGTGGAPVSPGIVLVRGDQIAGVVEGRALPSSYTPIDMPGAVAVPGFIDTHSYVGCEGELDEHVTAYTPQLSILDGFDPDASTLERLLESGVTTIVLAPGAANVMAGRTAVVKLTGGDSTRVLRRDAAAKVNILDSALRRDREPTSIPGLIHGLQRRLAEAGRHVQFACSTPEEIAAAIRFVGDLGLTGSLVGAEHGFEMADEIAAAGVTVLLGPPRGSDREMRNAAVLANAGVPIAFQTAGWSPREGWLRTAATLAREYGVARDTALAGLTTVAAKAAGVDRRIGMLRTGYDADIVVFDGDPLEPTSRVVLVIVDGTMTIVVDRREEAE